MRERAASADGGAARGDGPGRAGGATAQAVTRAVAGLLDSLPLPEAVRRSDDLRGTPRRVADAWLTELLDGYADDPGDILADTMPVAGGDLVAVTGIDFHAMCPHHLLPYRGVAHVGYVPGRKVVGFGQLARLVDALGHRLVIQEVLARQVAEALVEHLGARGAACVLDAEQLCLTIHGERRRTSRTHAQAFAGSMADGPLQRRFLALAGGGARQGRGGAARRSPATSRSLRGG